MDYRVRSCSDFAECHRREPFLYDKIRAHIIQRIGIHSVSVVEANNIEYSSFTFHRAFVCSPSSRLTRISRSVGRSVDRLLMYANYSCVTFACIIQRAIIRLLAYDSGRNRLVTSTRYEIM